MVTRKRSRIMSSVDPPETLSPERAPSKAKRHQPGGKPTTAATPTEGQGASKNKITPVSDKRTPSKCLRVFLFTFELTSLSLDTPERSRGRLSQARKEPDTGLTKPPAPALVSIERNAPLPTSSTSGPATRKIPPANNSTVDPAPIRYSPPLLTSSSSAPATITPQVSAPIAGASRPVVDSMISSYNGRLKDLERQREQLHKEIEATRAFISTLTSFKSYLDSPEGRTSDGNI